MVTVSEGIADRYAGEYGIPRPSVIMNAPYYQTLRPNPCGQKISIIHHGIAHSSRKIELMIEVMDHLDDRFCLDLMLVQDNQAYMDKLKRKAAPNPRIRFIPPVRMDEIPGKLNGYDLDVYILPPVNLNSALALPNKFFEFIQARLAVAIGPSPEMETYVKQYNCGVVSRDFTPDRWPST